MNTVAAVAAHDGHVRGQDMLPQTAAARKHGTQRSNHARVQKAAPRRGQALDQAIFSDRINSALGL